MDDTTRLFLAQTALKTELHRRTREGWQIVNQTDTTAQLKKARGGVGCGVVGFVLVPLVAGFLIHNIFYAIALLGLIVVSIALAFRRDDLLYIDGYQLAAAEKNK